VGGGGGRHRGKESTPSGQLCVKNLYGLKGSKPDSGLRRGGGMEEVPGARLKEDPTSWDRCPYRRGECFTGSVDCAPMKEKTE